MKQCPWDLGKFDGKPEWEKEGHDNHHFFLNLLSMLLLDYWCHSTLAFGHICQSYAEERRVLIGSPKNRNAIRGEDDTPPSARSIRLASIGYSREVIEGKFKVYACDGRLDEKRPTGNICLIE